MDLNSHNHRVKQIPDNMVDGIKKLRTDQIETLLVEREFHLQKFAQLKPGMIFLKEAGFEPEQNEILEVDLDMVSFKYIDRSVEKSEEKWSEMFEIPNVLYANGKAMYKGIKFKFDKPTSNYRSAYQLPILKLD